MTYKHGIYGSTVPSEVVISSSKNIPVYIGTAPVNELDSHEGLVNTPLLIRNLSDAVNKLGYSNTDDFNSYTLSGVVYAHFENSIMPIGPIVVINVYDPDTHTNVGAVTKTEIIGTHDASTNERTGLKCLDIVYEELGIVPNIISAPGFNHIPDVEKALVTACKNIGGRWDTICVTDIDPTAADNISEAIAWKTTNEYNSKLNKTCWPKGKMNEKAIWMSILTIVRMMQTDYANDGIPYETPSNKQIDISAVVTGAGSTLKLTIVQGNELNENGVTTAIYNGGKWVLWGPHMANYKYGEDIKAEDIFDVNIRMNLYLLNDFKLRNAELVDKPLDRNDVDAVMNSEQLRLNSLIADGKLLYGNIEFRAASNPTSDIIQGDFTFDTAVTNTPPAKSITNRIQYTSKGISTLTGGDQ